MSTDPKKRPRCGHPSCRKRLGIFDVPCKCGVTFCVKHRHGVTLQEQAAKDDHCHYCSFDYKAEYRERLEQEMKGNPKINQHSFNYTTHDGGAAY